MTQGIQKKDLKTLLEHLDSRMSVDHKTLQLLQETIQASQKKSLTYFQQSALVRYNPFGDTGGNQSFVISLLDAHGDGFVITSLHSREHTRIYAKEVYNGTYQDRTYSKEEREAIAQALKRTGKDKK